MTSEQPSSKCKFPVHLAVQCLEKMTAANKRILYVGGLAEEVDEKILQVKVQSCGGSWRAVLGVVGGI